MMENSDEKEAMESPPHSLQTTNVTTSPTKSHIIDYSTNDRIKNIVEDDNSGGVPLQKGSTTKISTTSDTKDSTFTATENDNWYVSADESEDEDGVDDNNDDANVHGGNEKITTAKDSSTRAELRKLIKLLGLRNLKCFPNKRGRPVLIGHDF